MIGLRASALALGVAMALVAMPVAADERREPLRADPERMGYAFDRPAMLLRQRLFGMAHGIMLLVSACLGQQAHADEAQATFDIWHGAQRDALVTIKTDLAFFYFGARAGEAGWQDVAGAIGLGETLRPPAGGVSLNDACATLPMALRQPRYDLAGLLAQGHAVPPAPTFETEPVKQQ